MSKLATFKSYVNSNYSAVAIVVGALALALQMQWAVPLTVMYGLGKVFPFLVDMSFIPSPMPLVLLLYFLIPTTTTGVVLMLLKIHRPFLMAFIGVTLAIAVSMILLSSFVGKGFIVYFVAALLTFTAGSRISNLNISIGKIEWIIVGISLTAGLAIYVTSFGAGGDNALRNFGVTMAIFAYAIPVLLLGVGAYWLVSSERSAKNAKGKRDNITRILGAIAVVIGLFILGLTVFGWLNSLRIDARIFLVAVGSLSFSLGLTHMILRKTLSYANVILAVSGLAILVVFYVMYSVRL